jgi:hypothetical protein
VAGAAHYACPYSSQTRTSYCKAIGRLIQISRGGDRLDMDYVQRLKCTCVHEREQLSTKIALVNVAALGFIGLGKTAIERNKI